MSGNDKSRRSKHNKRSGRSECSEPLEAPQSKIDLGGQDLGGAGSPSELTDADSLPPGPPQIATGRELGEVSWPRGQDGLEDGPEALQQTWARRAARLAHVPAEQEEGARVELVLVRLGGEVYGLDVQHVSDIRPVEQSTRVPRTPPWVAGVINLRGRILSLLDLERFLDLPQAGSGEHAKPYLVVVEIAEMELALLADEVLAVEALAASRIHDAGNMVRGIRPEYVRGIAERGQNGDGSMVVVLDLPAMLADRRLVVYEEVA